MIRDQALFAGGLLVERQRAVGEIPPAGLAKELGAEAYVPDSGEYFIAAACTLLAYRQPPNMTTSDATGREACWVWRARTNTPLQALTRSIGLV